MICNMCYAIKKKQQVKSAAVIKGHLRSFYFEAVKRDLNWVGQVYCRLYEPFISSGNKLK